MRLILSAVLVLLSVAPAYAISVGFSCITGNSAANCATGQSQFTVDVSDAGGDSVLFTFRNSGPLQSSITDVFFSDGPLLRLASIVNPTGVSFHQWAQPYELPGATLITPAFYTTKGFSADSDDIQTLSVNPGESLGVIFTLAAGRTYADTVQSLFTRELRIGLQAMAFQAEPGHGCLDDGHPCGGRESFVNVTPPQRVPEPPSLALLGSALVVLGVLTRRRRRR